LVAPTAISTGSRRLKLGFRPQPVDNFVDIDFLGF